jgi:hypothetical protein
MKAETLKSTRSSPEFSLTTGGPLFRLLAGSRLSDDGLTRAHRASIVIIPLLAWLPLLLLSAVGGQVFAGSVAVPFLPDLEVHVRFLLALPLLIIAELMVEQRMRPLLREFNERNLIPENAMTRFDAAVVSALRLRSSMLAEVLLIGFVYGIGILVVWRQYVALDAAAWYATPSADGSKLSFAGMWYGYVSLPIFQFLLFRWYFRLFVWARFLRQVSRIELNLVPTHPDRVGGLSFLSETTKTFSVFAAAHGALLAGYLATRVVVLGTALTEYKSEIATMVVFVLCVTLGPLLTFSRQLARTRLMGLREYGALATRYVGAFDSKWLRGGARSDQPLLGSADIQSLVDLGNSYNVVQSVRTALMTKEVIFRLAIATLVPIMPLLLTMMPLEELLKKLVGILLK